jgi:pimeloyl-ACP methyl ester carboxylesterase
MSRSVASSSWFTDNGQMHPWICLLTVWLVSGLVACTGPVPSPPGAATTPAPSAATSAAAVGINQLFSLGAGRRLKLECRGSQGPTVILESDDETDSGQWRFVLEDLDEVRVCRYDRAGLGESSRARGCRGAADLRGDLEDLLRAARLEPPYVLVGAGGGGFLVVEFALTHPDLTAGLVLAETPRAIRPSEWPDEVRVQLACTHPANLEHRDYVGIEKRVWDRRRNLGDLPMTVISNNYGRAPSNAEERSNVQDQRGWLELSGSSRQVIVTSGRNVPVRESELLADEIRRVVAQARFR